MASRPLRPHWSAFALFFWLAGALLAALPLLVGTVRVVRLTRRARALEDGSWLSMLRRLSESMRLSRHVATLASSEAQMPMTWGLLRPVVLLPAEADTWPAERQRAVLLHELAHVKRWDYLTQTLGWLACALHWINPLAWLALRRLRVEREQACDDYVLNAGMKPSVYADHLLSMVRGLRARGSADAAAVAMARGTGIGVRVKAVLDVSRQRGMTRTAAVVALAAAGVVLLPVAALHPVARAQEADEGTFGTRSSLGDSLPASVAARDVAGRVLKPDGTPAVGAMVFRCRYSYGRPDWRGFGEGVPVGGNGEFRLRDMAFDRVADLMDGIVARLPGSGLAGVGPGMIRRQSSGVDVQLPEEAILKGMVVDHRGTRLSEASVTVRDVWHGNGGSSRTVWFATAMPGWTVKTDTEGRFAIGWLPKAPVCTLTLIVRHRGLAAAAQTMEFGGGTEPPTIVLSPGGAIEGKVVHEDRGLPAKGIVLSVRCVRPTPSGGGRSVRLDETKTDENGSYRFPDLPAGPCHVSITRPRDAPWVTKAWHAATVSVGKTERVPDILLVKGGIVSGRVVDSQTREGLPRVSLWSSGGSTWTAADGSFRLRCLPGTQRPKHSHLPKDYFCHEGRAAEPITVAAGQTVEGVQIELSQGLTITGKVVDEQGNALPKAKVVCTAKPPHELVKGRYIREVVEFADANGAFRFRGLPAKTPVTLMARDREGTRGGTLDLSSAEETPAMATVKTVRLATITGRVLDIEGRPFPGVGVFVPPDASHTCTRTDGTYELTVMPGKEAYLAVCMTGHAPKDRHSLPWVTSSPGERRTVKDIVVVRKLQLSGRVLDPRGEPVPKAKVELSPDPQGLDLTTEADKDGRFAFKDVVPHVPRIAIRCRVAARGLAGYTFIEHDQQQVELRLGDAAVLTGRVTDGEGRPVAGAHTRAYVRMEGAYPRESGAATTDEHGEYQIEGVIPEGEVTVSAAKEGYVGRGSKWVPINGGAVVEVQDLMVLKGDSFIAGRVTDLAGAPLPRVHVSFTVPGAGSKFVQTDADGRYRIDCVPKGSTLLVITHSAKHRRAARRDIKAGSTDVDFRLTPKE